MAPRPRGSSLSEQGHGGTLCVLCPEPSRVAAWLTRAPVHSFARAPLQSEVMLCRQGHCSIWLGQGEALHLVSYEHDVWGTMSIAEYYRALANKGSLPIVYPADWVTDVARGVVQVRVITNDLLAGAAAAASEGDTEVEH